jgi:uncharacterized membrane protein YbhN (UPF0104 family)
MIRKVLKVKKFAPLFAAAVFCLAAYLLYRALAQYDAAEILRSVYALPPSRVALGALFAAGSYFTLTFWDALAVRYAGARLPYRRIALTSFTALSLGHTLGLAAASSGAIRYRFYARWGLGAGDIAKIILFCAATAALGLDVLLGSALLLQADQASKLLGLDRAVAVALGAACLAGAALYLVLAAAVRRPLEIRGWEITFPPLRLALAQIFVGAINFCLVAAALYHLLPPAAGIQYFTVLTVYVLANVAAIVSHVPGGLGVLEAVVLHLLPAGSVVAALVVFRGLYFLIPFAIGAALLAACELRQRRRG